MATHRHGYHGYMTRDKVRPGIDPQTGVYEGRQRETKIDRGFFNRQG